MDILHSSIISIIATILSLLFCGFIFHLLTKKVNGKKRYHPIGGTIFNQLINFHRLHHYMTDLAGKYKTYRLISPFRNEIYTSDPANVEYILKTNFDNYGKGWYNYSILKDLFGDDIFTVDGDKCKGQRKLSSHEFSTRVLRDFSSVVFRKNVAKLAHVLSEAANSNTTVDIQDLFMKSTQDSIFRVACGVELDSMCGSNEESKKFGDAFDNANAMTTWRYVDVFWKIKRALNIRVEAKLRDNIRTVDAFVYKLIQRKTEQMTIPEAELSAGSKICFSDDTLPDGFNVNKGDMVSYLPYAMGRMKFIWGDDAEEYKPERWLDHDGFFRHESPFKFTAFQGWHSYSILKDLLGDGIFTVDGDKWREQRKLSSHEFSTRVLRDFSSVVFRKNAAKFAHILSELVKSNKIVDIQDLFMKATIDSVFRVAFGVELDSMCGSNEQGKNFIAAFDDASAMTLWGYVDILWKIKRFLNIGSEAKLKEHIKSVDAFVYKLIHRKTEQMSTPEADLSVSESPYIYYFY
ncbi:hypothetical protein MTR67_004764 [Solanum verrucosum]|uniref:Cytochrome P450 n=1 Tax=Solanum verrucosum TaxID=315347 RepID=A0AAF0TAU4_SOLVR|nr:hypothetical protein MTR67_004764 [Solanum verrucosum]